MTQTNEWRIGTKRNGRTHVGQWIEAGAGMDPDREVERAAQRADEVWIEYRTVTTSPAPLRSEFMVCHAAGYPDPFRPHPNTLANAQRFAAEHGEKSVIKHRLVSDWATVDASL